MPKDPTIAIQDCLVEIGILHEIAARMGNRVVAMAPLISTNPLEKCVHTRYMFPNFWNDFGGFGGRDPDDADDRK